jgi:hypothetical protein
VKNTLFGRYNIVAEDDPTTVYKRFSNAHSKRRKFAMNIIRAK